MHLSDWGCFRGCAISSSLGRRSKLPDPNRAPASLRQRGACAMAPGASIPMGQGGRVPPQYSDWGDSIMNVHPNILRVTSVTFHPCNMFFCLHRHSEKDN